MTSRKVGSGRVRYSLNRNHFPDGLQGDQLEVDPNTPTGIAWRPPHGRPRGATEGMLHTNKIWLTQTDTVSGGGVIRWQPRFTGWTQTVIEGWTVAGNNEWEYTGAYAKGKNSREFLVNVSIGASGVIPALYWDVWVRILSGTSGSLVTVPGTEGASYRYEHIPFFASYLGTRHASAHGIVSLGPGDVFAVDYGHLITLAGAHTVVNWAPLSDHGFVVSVVPADGISV